MKKIIILLCIITALLFTACSDFLDTLPPTSISSEVAIENLDDAESVIHGIYNDMQSSAYYGHELIIYGDIRADDIQTYNENNGWYNFYVFNHKRGPGYDLWATPMRISRNASRIIEAIDNGKITDGTDTERNNVKGHAIALRALAHFDQARIYGYPYAKDQGKLWGAIIIDHVLEANELPVRNTVEESFTFITQELERAIPLMSDQKHPYNTLNSYGARALLARVYLYWDKNDKAYEIAGTLIEELKSSSYRLFTRDEYLEAFAYNSEGTNFNPESLLEIFNTPSDNPARNSLGFNYQTAGYYSYCVTKDFHDLIRTDPDDIRNGMVKVATVAQNERPFLIKYPGSADNVAAFDNNYPLIRLSEVYLIAAEAAIKSSNASLKTKGLEYLNAIVQRANPNKSVSNAEYTLDRVLEERRKELVGEGHRFFDLLRNGKKFQRTGGYHLPNATGFDISWDYDFSILGVPYNEFILNPMMKQLGQQNPGYTYE
ncbi:MAG: RagB/SusD family nutrient uptake outer membrane protein [Prevotellaceae bacterium]|jgi:hypothetical protein|nr:RagB/SusD family nutrient uptake outer membrane protein [Prevotellaceae bacterium]